MDNVAQTEIPWRKNLARIRAELAPGWQILLDIAIAKIERELSSRQPEAGGEMRAPRKSDCSGCRDNFYNGNNPLGVSECWMFKTAILVKKLDIHVDQRPPYNRNATTLRPSCYQAPRIVRVNPECLDARGFWK